MYDYYVEREFSAAVGKAYTALKQTESLSVYCYYGFLDLLQGTSAFYTSYNFLNNIAYNFGFMWTDAIMLLTGRPGATESDYFYYVAFYATDFVFRFIFKESSTGYCWLPWNLCDDIVVSTVVVDTSSTDDTTDDT
uniref:Uncharacterized protein n=1 Tax=Strombidium inclinatum TaxID=197538 RepID=A0A7S3MYS2_9SPIT|mmetsp:Transcript_30504/g.46757  ORF Transcript_30504/g.46757 Transcript_30504/m.46757 type:complete len:136 (+) Transcript_30504:505-912(+)